MENLVISPVRNFVKNNGLKFDCVRQVGRSKFFNLYDKNGNYCGDYFFKSMNNDGMSNLLLFDKDLNPIMQENIYLSKDIVQVKDPESELKLRTVPTAYRRIITTLDYVADKFRTVKDEIILQNPLVKLGKDDKDFIYRETANRYEEITDKLVYQKNTEIINEGLISDLKKNRDPHKKSNQFPFRFW